MSERSLGGGQGCQYMYKLRELGAQVPWEKESEWQGNVHGRPELRNGIYRWRGTRMLSTPTWLVDEIIEAAEYLAFPNAIPVVVDSGQV